MESPTSVHDNEILSYEVDRVERTIRFRTLFNTPEKKERTDVVFSGVECYRFEHDSTLQSIIHHFEPASPMEIFDGLEPELARTVPYGWPGLWASSRESAQRFFGANQLSAWYLVECVGMTGWVIAKQIEIVSVEA